MIVGPLSPQLFRGEVGPEIPTISPNTTKYCKYRWRCEEGSTVGSDNSGMG